MIKAIIPVAGVGTMLRPHTHTQPKPLIPVAGKPILGHIIENLLEAGITDFVFVIGYLGEKIRDFVTGTYSEQIKVEFVVQSPREGLGHAIWMARNEISAADEVLIVLGDTIFDVDMEKVMAAETSLLGVQEVEDPRSFGVAEINEQGFVTKVVEKPKIPKSNLALVGLYKIKEVPELVKCLEQMIQENKRSASGEFYLTDGLMLLLKSGVKIRTCGVDNWFDCGKKDTLLQTNRTLLERIPNRPSYKFKNCVIRHPVMIADGCQIEDSIIGPNVAIAEHAVIKNSIVRNSILGAYSRLEFIVLDGSVIGNDASLKGNAFSVNIGDNTEINFSS